jgi:NAD(P)H-dependent flavin oxidoreductase YrpB (nitropropane dioxygenase family)
VQMATRFIATQECDFWDVWKNAVLNSDDRDTLVGRGMFGPMRFITNRASLRLAERTARLFPEFLQGRPVDLHRELIEIEREGFEKLVKNDAEGSLIVAGEVSGRIKDLPNVGDLIERIVKEASEILRTLPDRVTP